jgi:hypothetical protein
MPDAICPPAITPAPRRIELSHLPERWQVSHVRAVRYGDTLATEGQGHRTRCLRDQP